MGRVKGGVLLLFCSHLRRCCLLWGPTDGGRGPSLLPGEVALSFALLNEDDAPGPASSLDRWWGVFHWEEGLSERVLHWKRSLVETELNELRFRCDEFEGPVQHQSRGSSRPLDVQINDGDVGLLVNCLSWHRRPQGLFCCYCPLDQCCCWFHSQLIMKIFLQLNNIEIESCYNSFFETTVVNSLVNSLPSVLCKKAHLYLREFYIYIHIYIFMNICKYTSK